MKINNYLKIITFFFSVFFYGQNTKIIILDGIDNKPLNGIQILSDTGSYIANSNEKGEFLINKTLLQKDNCKSILIYDTNFLPIEYKIDEIPSTIFLEETRHYQLDPVVIIKKKSQEYFTVKGYFRSWKLINNKLAKYSDGLIEYHIPYDKTKYHNFNTGMKFYSTQYRTFESESIEDKHDKRGMFGDRYLELYIHKRVPFIGLENFYKLEQQRDSLYTVYQEGINVGYTIMNNKKDPIYINISNDLEGGNAIHTGIGKIFGKFQTIEKWSPDEETKHVTYWFSSRKAMTKDRKNTEETINEIFIDDKIIYDDKTPEIYKKRIDRDESFYNTEYWKEQLAKHPLPSAIKEQLKLIKENKNDY